MEKTIQVSQEEHPYLDNPKDRPLVTIDSNVVIAIRNNNLDDPILQPARKLLALNHAGIITLNVTISTALEEQRPDEELEMHEYAAWLREQGIAPGNIFTHARTIGFHLPGDPPDTTTCDPQLEIALNNHIRQILFPEFPLAWVKYLEQECARFGIVGTKLQAVIELNRQDMYIPYFWPQGPARLLTPAFDSLEQAEQEEVCDLYKRLRRRRLNKLMDAVGLYNHLTQAVHTTHPEQAVFVSNDDNFFKQTKVAALRELGFPGKILRPAEAVAFLSDVTRTSWPDL